VPLIGGAVVHLGCQLQDVHTAGDHRLCVGVVTFAARSEGAPLLFHGSQYHGLAPLPDDPMR
jgi:flavin reductase (DIM6/NTAB) family NADH-FMN oxidoreductase RutF